MKQIRRRLNRDTRDGMTLIEVVVACTLLSITLTGLTAVAIRMGERTRNTAMIDQRTAVFFQEVNRVETLAYDSLPNANNLRSDSVYSGKGYYVWSYNVGAEVTSTTSGVLPYRNITLTVTPRLSPRSTQVATIRRSKAPYVNPLRVGP